MINLIFSDSSENWNKSGEKYRADGWYGNKDGSHTLSIHVVSFIGRLYVEGSLAEDPTDADWFAIKLPGQDYEYISYPRSTPNTDNGGETSTLGFTFSMNLTWLRIRMDRSYLGITVPPSQYQAYGSVGKVLLNA